MGTSRDERYETSCTMAEAAGILRAAGDALEAGGTLTLGGQTVDIAGFSKLKLSVKRDGVSATLKLKAAFGEVEAQDMGSAPPYKTLKKQMGADFKSLGRAVEAGGPLPPDTVARFLDDARLMTKYPGMGDEFYDEFRKSCEGFREAAGSADAGRIREAYDALRDGKKRCHAKFKK